MAQALDVSRQTVRKFGAAATAEVIEGAPQVGAQAPPAWDAAVDWAAVGEEVARGTTIKRLDQECAPEVSYTRFHRRLLEKVPKQATATIRLEHKPAEQTQIDYCDGVPIFGCIDGRCHQDAPVQRGSAVQLVHLRRVRAQPDFAAMSIAMSSA